MTSGGGADNDGCLDAPPSAPASGACLAFALHPTRSLLWAPSDQVKESSVDNAFFITSTNPKAIVKLWKKDLTTKHN